MDEITTDDLSLNRDFRRLQALVARDEVSDIANWPVDRIKTKITPRLFTLIMAIFEGADAISTIDELVHEESRPSLQLLKDRVKEVFQELVDSDIADELRASIPSFTPVDDFSVTPVSVAYRSYFVRDNEFLDPRIRVALIGHDEEVLSWLTLEWDDCLILSVSLAAMLASDLEASRDLIKGGAVVEDWNNLSELARECSERMSGLQSLIGELQDQAKDS